MLVKDILTRAISRSVETWTNVFVYQWDRDLYKKCTVCINYSKKKENIYYIMGHDRSHIEELDFSEIICICM